MAELKSYVNISIQKGEKLFGKEMGGEHASEQEEDK